MEKDMWNGMKIMYDKRAQQVSSIDVYRENIIKLEIDLVWHANRASDIPKNQILFDKKAWKEVCDRVPRSLDFGGVLFGLEGLDVEGLNASLDGLGWDVNNKEK